MNFLLANNNTLGELEIEILGDNGNKRFLEFSEYKDGWDTSGKKLNHESIVVMKKFLRQFRNYFFSRKIVPSIFLTRDGNLSLGWETKDNNSIEVEFFPDNIEYYLEEGDIEDRIPANNIGFNKLQTLLKE